MGIPEQIAAIRAQRKDERAATLEIYALKTNVLLGVIERGRTVAHKDYTFRINDAKLIGEGRLFLDVTFARPPSGEITHQITITNPPVLPRERTGNERDDLITAISEMLEGFV
jgi:hypothetical protein